MPPIKEVDELNEFVRCYSHDVRNHMNGIEMELTLMELVSDPDKPDSIARIRDEMEMIKSRLRYLSNRFVVPERLPVPAIDVFNQWKSRITAIPDESEVWNCSLSNACINVDMRMVSDTLSEWLLGMRSTPPEKVAVEQTATEVRFSVHQSLRDGEQKPLIDTLPAGFISLIESNGGEFREETPPDRRSAVGICGFPIVA